VTGTNDAPLITAQDVTGLVTQQSGIIGEAGTMLASQEGPDEWMQVNFAQVIPDAVVAMMLNTENGRDAAVMRVRNVTDTGFEYQVDEYEVNDGSHSQELISWVAVSTGDHMLADGTVIKAGYTTANTDVSSVVFNTEFVNAPVVLTQVSSGNEAEAVTTRNITTLSGFEISLQEQLNNTSHTNEQVGWLAIDQGAGTSIETGLTGDNVSHTVTNVSFDLAFPTSLAFLAQMQTLDGGQTAAIRGTTLSSTGASVFVEEPTTYDGRHTTENVGYVALPVGQIDGQIQTPLTDTGFIEFTDVDFTDMHNVSVDDKGTDYVGSLTATIVDDSTGDQAGNIIWDFAVDNADIVNLGAGEQLIQDYTVTVADGKGGTVQEVVSITLNGTNDIIFGSENDDILTGLAGNDTLTGGLGADTFFFNPEGEDETDTITDFAIDEDVIDLSAFAGMGYDNLGKIISHSKQTDGDVNIDLGNGNSVTLVGVDLDSLHADNFIFG